MLPDKEAKLCRFCLETEHPQGIMQVLVEVSQLAVARDKVEDNLCARWKDQTTKSARLFHRVDM